MNKYRLKHEPELQVQPIRLHARIPLFLLLLWTALFAFMIAGCGSDAQRVDAQPALPESAQAAPLQLVAVDPDEVKLPIVIAPSSGPSGSSSESRGYLTTPQELKIIAGKVKAGTEPYADAAKAVIEVANKKWDYNLDKNERCRDSDTPKWIDDNEGIPRLYARALAYHLTGEERYAAEVRDILEMVMTQVKTIDINDQQCRLNFGWGTPELVASADLIEGYWKGQTCQGPLSTLYTNTTIGGGKCKTLFQNWLVKNAYYVISLSASASNSNWGAAATNSTAYIADYLWDRPEVKLLHREPPQLNNGADLELTPREAYAYANKLMLDRMNGYKVEYQSSDSCDYLSGVQQSNQWQPVKSQITENGIIPEDARRADKVGFCNVPQYVQGLYQNYPQIHVGNNIQQCELMLRRGDRKCYDNVDNTTIQEFAFIGPDGQPRVTTLYAGRGSLERAINAVIVDAKTEWKHDPALEIAYRYYYTYHRLPGFDQWFAQLDGNRPVGCSQNACFTTLTHGFASGETPALPPTVSPP